VSIEGLDLDPHIVYDCEAHVQVVVQIVCPAADLDTRCSYEVLLIEDLVVVQTSFGGGKPRYDELDNLDTSIDVCRVCRGRVCYLDNLDASRFVEVCRGQTRLGWLLLFIVLAACFCFVCFAYVEDIGEHSGESRPGGRFDHQEREVPLRPLFPSAKRTVATHPCH
jgi:hypothetical protein